MFLSQLLLFSHITCCLGTQHAAYNSWRTAVVLMKGDSSEQSLTLTVRWKYNNSFIELVQLSSIHYVRLQTIIIGH